MDGGWRWSGKEQGCGDYFFLKNRCRLKKNEAYIWDDGNGRVSFGSEVWGCKMKKNYPKMVWTYSGNGEGIQTQKENPLKSKKNRV